MKSGARRRGYALATRRAIETRARSLGARKVYCTAPDTAVGTVQYLLAAGMRIEGHLARHYSTAHDSTGHDELVFGKFLVADDYEYRQPIPVSIVPGTIAEPRSFDRRSLASAVRTMFAATWHDVSLDYARRIVSAARSKATVTYADKPKRLVCLRAGTGCVAAVILVPKRGGSVKGILLRATDHEESLAELVREAMQRATALKQRKIYFLHPLTDSRVVLLLRQSGLVAEGLLRAPYRAPYTVGQDVVVMSKLL